MTKGLPLFGQVDECAMDYRLRRAEAVANGLGEDDPAWPVILVADQLAMRACRSSETDAAILAALIGREGIRSVRFLERVRNANRDKLIEFPRRIDPLSAA